MNQDKLSNLLEAIEQRTKDKREKHRTDVRYVQEHYPALAEFLAEFSREFGKGGFAYRVTIKHF